ncbi:MAG: hypothetical protein HGB12_14905 [Bacteroidetes bacterium]|nr:hypothetical protein [Bacteroidota bacterium]
MTLQQLLDKALPSSPYDVRNESQNGRYKMEILELFKSTTCNLPEEIETVIKQLAKAHNAFVRLPVTHPDHNKEWCEAIHKLNGILALKIVSKWYPDTFLTLKG